MAPLDVEGYSADLARCREEFPDLRILSGIEAGEPHLFPASVAAVLAAGNFERVLGSLHGIVYDGTLTGIDDALFARLDAHEVMRRYFADLVVLVDGSSVFNVLAHCDYPRRYWPTARAGVYAEADFEEEYRAVFRALASSGRALEINTRSPLASADLMRWWWQEGGDAVSFGSDAHRAVSGRRALRSGGGCGRKRPASGLGAIVSISGDDDVIRPRQLWGRCLVVRHDLSGRRLPLRRVLILERRSARLDEGRCGPGQFGAVQRHRADGKARMISVERSRGEATAFVSSPRSGSAG